MKTAKWDQPVFAKLQMQWYIHHWTSTNLRSYDVRYICVTNIRKTYELCFSLVYRSMRRQRELRFLTDTVIRISKLTVKSNICAVLCTPNKVYPFFPCLVYITRKFFVFANKSSKYLHITHTHTQNKETLDKFIVFTWSVATQERNVAWSAFAGSVGQGAFSNHYRSYLITVANNGHHKHA